LTSIQLSLGLNLQKQNQHREAAEIFAAALKKDPTDPIAHFNLAVSYFRLGRIDEAAREASATLAIAPYYTRAHELLGTIAMQHKDLAGARSHFENILQYSSQDYAAHYNLGAISLLEEHWDEGQQHLIKATEIDPESSEAHNTLGSLYLRKTDLEN